MTNADMPKNASDWTTFLLEQSLPSPFKVGRLTLKSMERETLPYSRIAQQLTNDPVLSYYLMEAAGQEAGDQTEYSKTLDHAISMIGVDQVKDTIRKLPSEDPSSEEVGAIYYAKMLARGLFAAHLAKAIAQKKAQFNGDDLYWSGLFVYVPLWYLWRFATPEMRLMRYAVNTKHKAKVQAQTDVLNCTVEEISAELVKKLALPPIVKHCYEAEHQLTPKHWVQLSRCMKSQGQMINQIDDRELKMLVQQPGFIVQLVKLIADASMHCWYSRATTRTMKILAAYLNITTAEASKFCHEVAADASRAHPIPGIFLPATRLFLPPVAFKKPSESSSTTDKQSTSNATTSPITAASETQAQTNTQSAKTGEIVPKAVFTELANSMYKKPDDFADLHELMNGATSALVYGLGLSRATASLINKERTRIKTYYSTGCQNHSEMAAFDARLVKGTIFSRLATKPASVWIKPSSEEKVLSLVPSNFKQVVETDNYIMMSVFVKDKPFAVIYADAHPEGKITEAHYKYFKYLCKGLGLALDHLVRNKAKKAAEQ